MKVSQTNIWLCHDCLYVNIYNDYSHLEEPGGPKRYEIASGLWKWRKASSRIGPHLVPDFGHLRVTTADDNGVWDWTLKKCDCCGTEVGGARFRFALLEKE